MELPRSNGESIWRHSSDLPVDWQAAPYLGQSHVAPAPSPRLRHVPRLDTDHCSPSVYSDKCFPSPTLPTLSSHATPTSKEIFRSKSKRRSSKSMFNGFSDIRRVVLAWIAKSPLRHHSQSAWLLLYFSFNLLLTLSNKSVLSGFPFPYTLTALHALFSTVGGFILRRNGFYRTKQLDFRSELVLACFSFLYAINVAVSNVSLHLVTVPFHQVVRALTPMFTIFLSGLLFNTPVSTIRLVSLAPVILGVVLATYGDYYFTAWGLILTLFGTFLAAVKTIYTNVLQSSRKPIQGSRPPATPRMPIPATWRHKHALSTSITRPMGWTSSWACVTRYFVPPQLDLHPLDLLTRMSPLAFVQCVIYAQMSGELERLKQFGIYNAHKTAMQDITSLASDKLMNSTDPWNTASIYGCLHVDRIHIIGGIPLSQALVLILNGCIAFGLNVVSFSANGKVGPLSMTVAANVKQVLTILCAVSLFNLTITPMNALGITVTLVGGAWYAWVEYTSKSRDRRKEDTR